MLCIEGGQRLVTALPFLRTAGNCNDKRSRTGSLRSRHSHWFDRHRGLALGLSMMGIGIGSIVVPILAQRLITLFGWRMAFALLTLILLTRLGPYQCGGSETDPADHAPGSAEQRISRPPARTLHLLCSLIVQSLADTKENPSPSKAEDEGCQRSREGMPPSHLSRG